tara:strand:- start:1182 stop:1349 length:168 start_codon:yes stop_codon:yes gene_type:complete
MMVCRDWFGSMAGKPVDVALRAVAVSLWQSRLTYRIHLFIRISPLVLSQAAALAG